jgi:hypothetical protein
MTVLQRLLSSPNGRKIVLQGKEKRGSFGSPSFLCGLGEPSPFIFGVWHIMLPLKEADIGIT